MKPLILILLAATYAAAQNPTIADIARQERARRAQSTGAKVYTIKAAPPAATETPAGAGAPPAAGTAPAGPTTGAPPANPVTGPAAPTADATTEVAGADPVKQWLEEMEKLRARIRQLVDQETSTQLEINTITNRVYAPVTSVPERERAQAELGVVQNRLVSIREELARARVELQVREQDGPPKK